MPPWRERLALEPNILVLGAGTFLLTLGHGLWWGFAPRYLEALGATAVVVGLWGSLTDALDAAWQYPGGALADRIGRKNTLLALTALSAVGILLFLVPAWPVVLAGLVLYMATMAYAQPATFAVIGDALPRERRAMGFVVQSTLKRVPLLIAPPIAGFVITVHLGVLDGVRAGLLAALVFTLLALLAQWKGYRSDTDPRAAKAGFHWADLTPTLKRLLASDALVRMGESATKVFIVLYVVTVLGFTDLDFGLLLALQAAVVLAVYYPAARAADRGARKPWVALTFLFFTLYPLTVLLARTHLLLVLAFAVGGLREIGEPARKASIVDQARAEHRGRVVGTYYTVRGFAIMPVALVAGLLWTIDPTWPFYFGALLSGAGLLSYLATVPHE